MFHTLLTSIVVVLLFTPLVSGAEEQPAKPKAADSPEQALKLLTEAAKAGDADAFTAQLGGCSRALFDMGRSLEAFQTAMDERFGKERGRDAGSDIKAEMDRFNARTHRIQGRKEHGDARVDLTVWVVRVDRDNKEYIQEETWTSLKDEWGWKIDFPDKGIAKDVARKDGEGQNVIVSVIETKEYDAASSAKGEKYFAAATKLIDEFAKDVKAGKYATRDAAVDAFDTAKQKLSR